MTAKVKILIVDDEPTNRKLIRLVLSNERYDIAEAPDGSAALEQIKANLPDLILLDVMMPELNGWEVTKILKNNPETMHIPIVLVTALNNISDKMKGLELGANEYLEKPINYKELRALVNSTIKLKSYLDGSTTVWGVKDGNSKLDRPSPHPSVLIVEDDEKHAKLLQNYLREESYQIAWTDTGERALEIAGKKKFDLILLDILLPNMDGFEVLEHLKQMQSARDVPIMVVSVLQDIESKIKAYESGANVYLTKPMNKDELKIRIRNLTMKNTCRLGFGQSNYSNF